MTKHASHVSSTTPTPAQKEPATFADWLFNKIEEVFTLYDTAPHIELGRWNLDANHKNRVVKKIDLANSDNSYKK